MITYFGAAICAVATFAAAPALAWTTLQGNGQVAIRHEVPGYVVEMKCERGMDHVAFSLARTGGATFGSAGSVAFWVAYPDGRKGWQVVDVANRGQYVEGRWAVSDIVLDEFRQAAGFEFQLDGATIFSTDARGTGAARLAILEQCGL